MCVCVCIYIQTEILAGRVEEELKKHTEQQDELQKERERVDRYTRNASTSNLSPKL